MNHDWITNTLEDIKAQEIQALNVSHLTDVTDTMIVCHGTSTTHIHAIAGRLQQTAKAQQQTVYLDGIKGADWILVDCGDAIVHVMTQEARAYYALEKLWDIAQTHCHHED